MSNTYIHIELITLPVVYIDSCNAHTIDNYNEQRKKNRESNSDIESNHSTTMRATPPTNHA
jgi:hypothetical protein